MDLLAILRAFAETCNQNQRLRAMNHDWTRQVSVVAVDSGEAYWIRSLKGELSAGEGGFDGLPDMEIRADESVLSDVFSGRVSPTEPYNQGDLLVRGNQDDIFRLDVITLMIWGD